MKTEKLLEELENLIETSSHMPLTNKKMIEEEDIMRLVDALTESLPLELEESRRIVAERDRIIAEGQQQAEALVAQAKEYIQKLTEESELVKQAQEHANHIIAEANKSSEELKNSSIQYASDVFKYVESNLEKTLESLKENRQTLQK
ncbi:MULTISPECIES: ATPase [unclassified Veillonella]|uniref:ATPase n=1 Tax=unclassified Veillonella TaxID=2630086 RepID=UPI000F8DA528|nr:MULTISPECIES: ATPase [unclassified Veillonella]